MGNECVQDVRRWVTVVFLTFFVSELPMGPAVTRVLANTLG